LGALLSIGILDGQVFLSAALSLRLQGLLLVLSQFELDGQGLVIELNELQFLVVIETLIFLHLFIC
jgi:hypothetical protein